MIMNFEHDNLTLKSYFGQANYSTCNPGPSTPCLQWLVGAALTQIILIQMNYAAATDNRVRTHKLYLVVEKVKLGCAILICLYVAKVSHVTVASVWAAMMLTEGVEVWGEAITAVFIIGKITQLMDVKGMLAVRGQTLDSSENFSFGLAIFLPGLMEPHVASGIILGWVTLHSAYRCHGKLV